MSDAIATKRSRRSVRAAVGLLAAFVGFPLLVPPSAVAWELLPLEARLALEATEISSAKVCGASECRELSDPEAATALAVGRARGTAAPVRGLPWYKTTLTIRAKELPGGVGRVSATVVPSAGLMGVADGTTWVTLSNESRAAYAKLTAGLAPRPATTLPSAGTAPPPVARVDKVVGGPSAATPAPASDGSKVWIVALGGGVLLALMAGLLLSRRHRHRRAPRPPGASEAPT